MIGHIVFSDPLSPALFIIVAKVLVRRLNNLHEDVDFKGYGLSKWSPMINHLFFIDDIIFFYFEERSSVI